MQVAVWVLALFCTAFSLIEKRNKESFVLNYTNASSRKILLNMINSSPYPLVIVGKDGVIQFCNEQFEQMLTLSLNINNIPKTIYKLTSEDEESTYKLK